MAPDRHTFQNEVPMVSISTLKAYCNSCHKNRKITVFRVGHYTQCRYCFRKAEKKKDKEERASAREESYSSRRGFCDTKEWRILRGWALEFYGEICHACGSKERIQVDHIKPKSKYPELAYEFDNLQVLCRACNFDKSNYHEIDYRLTTLDGLENDTERHKGFIQKNKLALQVIRREL